MLIFYAVYLIQQCLLRRAKGGEVPGGPGDGGRSVTAERPQAIESGGVPRALEALAGT